MPNWCENQLTMTGPKQDVRDLWEKIENDSQFFEHMVPNPKGEWDYGWSCENWGTKWDANFSEGDMECWDNDDGTATIQGNILTAWSPPIQVFQTWQESNDWDIELWYIEDGISYMGVWKNDEEIHIDDVYETYKNTPRDDWDDSFKYVAEFFDLEERYYDWDDEEEE